MHLKTTCQLIKLSRAQISNIIQSGGFLGSLLSKLDGPLMKVAVTLAKNILAPLGITAASSAKNGAIQKKIHGSGTTTLIISNEEMNDIIKIVQVSEDSEILLKGITKTIKNETKKQNGRYLSMSLGTFASTLLGNMFARKRIVRAGYGNKGGKGIVRAGYGSKKKIIPAHPLTNFEIQKYYEDKPRFNGVYSRDNLPKTIKNGAYVINLDKYADVGTHWVTLYVKNNEVFYFDSFGEEHIPKTIMHFIGHKDIKNIIRIQTDNSIKCGYFCILFVNFMLPGKTLINYTSSFSPYKFGKNDDIALSYLKWTGYLKNQKQFVKTLKYCLF